MSTPTLTAPTTLVSTYMPPVTVMDRVRQFGLIMQWQLRRGLQMLPLLIVVQILLAAATIIGFGLLVGDPERTQGLYLATGAPTVTLIMVGLVMTPQFVSQSRTEGSLDWMRTLPVPRMLFLFADLAVWTLIALPGLVISVLAGAWRFDVDLSMAWWVVPAAIIVSMTAASIGYALASLLPAMLAQLMSQVLVFLVLLFTPVSYPADRMPEWAQSVHEWLPLEPMAQVMRAGLAANDFTVDTRSWIVLAVWCVAAVAGAAVAVRKRG